MEERRSQFGRRSGDQPERRVWTKAGPVDSATMPDEEIEAHVERREISIAEPGAMALFGFAVGTFIVAFPVAGLVPASAFFATIPPVLIFAGIAQFIGGLVAYRRGNTFAGTAFCSYGANNVVVATFFFLKAAKVIPAAPGSPAAEMLALELFCFALISLVFAIGALRLNVTFTLVLVALVPGFALAGIPNAAGTGVSLVIGHIGGYFLIASAALAAYAAAALVLNSVWQRRFLPLGSLA
jgi:succinate-acetate transporter protein